MIQPEKRPERPPSQHPWGTASFRLGWCSILVCAFFLLNAFFGAGPGDSGAWGAMGCFLLGEFAAIILGISAFVCSMISEKRRERSDGAAYGTLLSFAFIPLRKR